MIEILPSPDHVFAVRLTGTLTGEDFDRMTSELEKKLARHERVGVFADATGFDDLTAEAAGKDIRYNLSKLGQWKRFPREAVVTDRHWLRALIKMMDPLVPQVDVRCFSPAERDEAMAWASDLPPS